LGASFPSRSSFRHETAHRSCRPRACSRLPTTPADRIAQHRSAFDTWPAEVQTKIRAGQIAVGFTEEQVRMALGDPEHHPHDRAGRFPGLGYRHRGPHFSFGMGMAGGSGHTGYGAGVAMTDRPYSGGDALHVVMMNGQVVSIERAGR
jgi:hypothetical protein